MKMGFGFMESSFASTEVRKDRLKSVPHAGEGAGCGVCGEGVICGAMI